MPRKRSSALRRSARQSDGKGSKQTQKETKRQRKLRHQRQKEGERQRLLYICQLNQREAEERNRQSKLKSASVVKKILVSISVVFVLNAILTLIKENWFMWVVNYIQR